MNKFKRKIAENLRHPKGTFGLLIGAFMNHFNKGIIQHTIQSIPLRDNYECIVEVGIGSGKAIQILAEKFPGTSIIGIDISKIMLKSAENRNRKLIQKGLLKLQLSSIENLKLESQSVDCLFSINTLYFWNDPDKVCKEISRVLKEDACFILSFNPENEMNKNAYPDDIFSFYSLEDGKEMLKKNSFKIASIQSIKDRYEKYVCIVATKARS